MLRRRRRGRGCRDLEKEGRDTVESLRAKGHEALFVPVDLADAQSVEAMGETLGKEWGRIDGLVNNGALATRLGAKRFENIDLAVGEKAMAVNVRGVWLATGIPWIRKSEHGKIVNISSDTALSGSDFLLHYVASRRGDFDDLAPWRGNGIERHRGQRDRSGNHLGWRRHWECPRGVIKDTWKAGSSNATSNRMIWSER